MSTIAVLTMKESARIPGKNTKLKFAGKTGLEWMAKAVHGMNPEGRLRVIASSDEEEQIAAASACGIDGTLIRVSVNHYESLLNTVKHAENVYGETYDHVMMPEACNPLVTSRQLDDLLELANDTGADYTTAVFRVPKSYHPYWCFVKDASTGALHPVVGGWAGKSQWLPEAFSFAGVCHIWRRDMVTQIGSMNDGSAMLMSKGDCFKRSLATYPVEWDEVVDIDTEGEVLRAQSLMEARHQEA